MSSNETENTTNNKTTEEENKKERSESESPPPPTERLDTSTNLQEALEQEEEKPKEEETSSTQEKQEEDKKEEQAEEEEDKPFQINAPVYDSPITVEAPSNENSVRKEEDNNNQDDEETAPQKPSSQKQQGDESLNFDSSLQSEKTASTNEPQQQQQQQEEPSHLEGSSPDFIEKRRKEESGGFLPPVIDKNPSKHELVVPTATGHFLQETQSSNFKKRDSSANVLLASSGRDSVNTNKSGSGPNSNNQQQQQLQRSPSWKPSSRVPNLIADARSASEHEKKVPLSSPPVIRKPREQTTLFDQLHNIIFLRSPLRGNIKQEQYLNSPSARAKASAAAINVDASGHGGGKELVPSQLEDTITSLTSASSPRATALDLPNNNNVNVNDNDNIDDNDNSSTPPASPTTKQFGRDADRSVQLASTVPLAARNQANSLLPPSMVSFTTSVNAHITTSMTYSVRKPPSSILSLLCVAGDPGPGIEPAFKHCIRTTPCPDDHRSIAIERTVPTPQKGGPRYAGAYLGEETTFKARNFVTVDGIAAFEGDWLVLGDLVGGDFLSGSVRHGYTRSALAIFQAGPGAESITKAFSSGEHPFLRRVSRQLLKMIVTEEEQERRENETQEKKKQEEKEHAKETTELSKEQLLHGSMYNVLGSPSTSSSANTKPKFHIPSPPTKKTDNKPKNKYQQDHLVRLASNVFDIGSLSENNDTDKNDNTNDKSSNSSPYHSNNNKNANSASAGGIGGTKTTDDNNLFPAQMLFAASAHAAATNSQAPQDVFANFYSFDYVSVDAVDISPGEDRGEDVIYDVLSNQIVTLVPKKRHVPRHLHSVVCQNLPANVTAIRCTTEEEIGAACSKIMSTAEPSVGCHRLIKLTLKKNDEAKYAAAEAIDPHFQLTYEPTVVLAFLSTNMRKRIKLKQALPHHIAKAISRDHRELSLSIEHVARYDGVGRDLCLLQPLKHEGALCSLISTYAWLRADCCHTTYIGAIRAFASENSDETWSVIADVDNVKHLPTHPRATKYFNHRNMPQVDMPLFLQKATNKAAIDAATPRRASFVLRNKKKLKQHQQQRKNSTTSATTSHSATPRSSVSALEQHKTKSSSRERKTSFIETAGDDAFANSGNSEKNDNNTNDSSEKGDEEEGKQTDIEAPVEF